MLPTKPVEETVFEMFPDSFMVGGSIRDRLLNIEPKDYDFATPLTPDEIEATVRKHQRKPYLIGKKFGTVGFKVDGQMVEMTTFRSETYHAGSRKPDVAFVTDIDADLSRRDFTINAIALLPDNSVYDPFNGAEDLKKHIIRAVGKPRSRFKEDPLRLLRMCRFSAQFGGTFNIESVTLTHALKLSHSILDVSRERWVIELDKMLIGERPSVSLDHLAGTRLLNYMLPELSLQVMYDQNSPYHSKNLWGHTTAVVDAVPNDICLRWAALLHDVAKPFTRTEHAKGHSNYIHHERTGAEIVQKIGHYLRWSNDRINTVASLVLHHLEEDSPLKTADEAAK